HLSHALASDQPRSAAEAELEFVRLVRLDVDVIVSVIADRMARGGQLLEPVDAGMLENLADTEIMDDAAAFLDNPSGLDGVFLGRLVEVALLIVPLGDPAARILGAHLQIEGDGDEGLLAGRFFLGTAQSSRAEKSGSGGNERTTSCPSGLVHDPSLKVFERANTGRAGGLSH